MFSLNVLANYNCKNYSSLMVGGEGSNPDLLGVNSCSPAELTTLILFTNNIGDMECHVTDIVKVIIVCFHGAPALNLAA